MATEQIYPSEEVNFIGDLSNAFIRTILVIFLWYLFFYYYYLILSFGLIGLVIIFVVMMLILPYTFSSVSLWFNIWAYKIVSWQTSLPYMNYKTSCPFLKRKRLNFSCHAEQIDPFEKDKFERCHREPLWEACWPQRIPSILQVYDEAPSRKKQQLASILAAMKEHAAPSGMKMLEALNSDILDVQTRLYAGLALAAMGNEAGIVPLLNMLGNYEPRTDQTIRAVLSRYGETALPYLINAVQDCDDDNLCGGLVEIMGKIEHENSIPTLDSLLKSETTGEYTRLQTIYALQELDSEEAIKTLLVNFEKAPLEEQSQTKEVFLSRKLISFPLLIELLPNREISEDYYSRIGDVLAEVDARTYDRLFTKLREIKDLETVQKLARILKENTPEEEEFLTLHKILDKHIFDQGLL
jgi:hypothetical protein